VKIKGSVIGIALIVVVVALIVASELTLRQSARDAAAPSPAAMSADGQALFNQRCKTCHNAAAADAPEQSALAAHPRATIVATLTSGEMADMAKDLTPAQIAAIATYLTPSQGPAASPAQGTDDLGG
jgi:mono/diheme cytochrome c family protein